MRLIVFFDLPTKTMEDLRNYRLFRKFLIKNGFLMMQESVYCKMVLNATGEQRVHEAIKKNRPPKGIVQLLIITEKQFARMDFITGKVKSDVIDTDERLVIF